MENGSMQNRVMNNRLNLALGLALAMVVAVLVFYRADPSKPNYQVILGDDMTYSPAYGSYDPNDNFANGRTLQNPVPGTVAYDTWAPGEQPFHYEATPEEATRAGQEMINPYDQKPGQVAASAERGQIAFQTFCTACHGGDGAGNGPVAQRGFPPPPSLLIGKSRDMKDGQLFHILTCGQNSMPTFALQLPPARRWDLINYLRRLQREAPPVTTAEETTAEETKADEQTELIETSAEEDAKAPSEETKTDAEDN